MLAHTPLTSGDLAIADAGSRQPPDALGDRVKRARTARGLSQAELARRVGVSVAQVSDVERGKRKKLQRHTLEGYARVLGVDPDYLRVESTSLPPEALPLSMEEWLRQRLDLSDERNKEHMVETYRVLRELERRRQVADARDRYAAYDREKEAEEARRDVEEWPE